MRVLIGCYTDVRQGGGGATRALRTGEGLQQRGFDVHILSKVEQPPQRSTLVAGAMPTTLFVTPPARIWRLRELDHEARLLSAIRAAAIDEPDAVLAISPFFVNVARTMWPGARIVFILPSLLFKCARYLRHTPPGLVARLNDRLLQRAERRALRQSDAVIVATRAAAEDAAEFCRRRTPPILIQPPGATDLAVHAVKPRHEVRRSLGTPQDAVVMISVGNVDANKNMQLAIRSLDRARRENLHLWIAGVGRDEEFLAGLAARLGLTDRVRQLGFRRDLGELFAAADALLHTARYEAFGHVYVEAMLAGLPVIGPTYPPSGGFSALADIIVDGRHGWLYDGSDAESLPSILRQCADHPERLAPMGQAARDHVRDRFRWEPYFDCVADALNGAGRATRNVGGASAEGHQ